MHPFLFWFPFLLSTLAASVFAISAEQYALNQGKSFEKRHLYAAAAQIYQQALADFPASPLTPRFLLGLQNLAYKEGNHAQALQRFQEIRERYSQSPYYTDASYLAGQTFFQLGRFQECIDLMASIGPHDPNYLYARYTQAMALYRNGQTGPAKIVLQEMLDQHAPRNASESEILNFSRVKLGHLYLDHGDNSRPEPDRLAAARLYLQVETHSPAFSEARLALGWCLLQAYRPVEARALAEQVLARNPSPWLQADARNLQGLSYLIQRQYLPAKQIFADLETWTEKPFVSQNAIDSVQQVMEDLNESLLEIQVQAVQGRSTPAKLAWAENVLGAYAKFQLAAQQSQQFEHLRKRTLDDAQFYKALAKSRLPSPPSEGEDSETLF